MFTAATKRVQKNEQIPGKERGALKIATYLVLHPCHSYFLINSIISLCLSQASRGLNFRNITPNINTLFVFIFAGLMMIARLLVGLYYMLIDVSILLLSFSINCSERLFCGIFFQMPFDIMYLSTYNIYLYMFTDKNILKIAYAYY